jgi:hypothetical protein
MIPGTPVSLNGHLRIVHRRVANDKRLLGAYQLWNPLTGWIEIAWARDLWLLSGRQVRDHQDITALANWGGHLEEMADEGIRVFSNLDVHFTTETLSKKIRKEALDIVRVVIKRYWQWTKDKLA